MKSDIMLVKPHTLQFVPIQHTNAYEYLECGIFYITSIIYKLSYLNCIKIKH